MDKLEEKVLKTIKKYNLINIGDKVVVGVSGGPDSVCLLYILHSLTDILHFTIYVSHINHMMRGNESNEDEKHVRELCEELGIDFYTTNANIVELSKEEGKSIEETGREVRYRVFNDLALRLGAGKIAVAHNKNDQAETVLMRIIRGTGLEGLKGMDFKRDKVIRPLLDVERHEIEGYCKIKSIEWRTDSSNLENVYTRNKLRLELIPFIDKKFETDFTKSIYKMSSILKEENVF